MAKGASSSKRDGVTSVGLISRPRYTAEALVNT